MSKIKLLLDVVDDMRSLADSIQAVCEAMMQNESDAESKAPKAETPTPKPEPKQSKAEKVLTIEEVRPILGKLSHDGFTEDVRSLLHKYGANRLGEIDPKHYAELLKDAEGLSNAAK